MRLTKRDSDSDIEREKCVCLFIEEREIDNNSANEIKIMVLIIMKV